MNSSSTPSARLYFLDWVRIIAFFILILYHVGMYYVTWGWHVKSVHASTALEPFMQLSSPWRLSLLFLVSGAASSFMLAKAGVARFLRQRSLRLLVPLLFGMLVVVPPQPYFEVIEKLGYAASYADFMRLYLSGYGGFCRDGCLILPTWNHLWFVAYLWVYTLVLALMALALGPRLDALSRRLEQLLSGWNIIVLPLAVLALARIVLFPRFPQTHALAGDWYNHATYFFVFLLGALLGRRAGFWERLAALRWASLGTALVCWCLMMVWQALPDSTFTPGQLALWLPPARSVTALCTWSAIAAACGFARRHLQFDGPARRYLTEAVFPVYIVHQTLIVTIAHALKPAGIAPGLEGIMLVVLTVALSFAIFEAVRRSALLRPLFGLARMAADGRKMRPLGAGADVVQSKMGNVGTRSPVVRVDGESVHPT
jgi:glucan biosynthesis protein C